MIHKEQQHFWKSKTPEESVFNSLSRLEEEINRRESYWKRYLGVYLNHVVTGLHPGDRATSRQAFKNRKKTERRLALNPIKNCIKTLGARIATQRPMVKIQTSTSGPNAWSQKVKARGLEKFILGEWERAKFYQKTVKIFHYAAAVGIGAMHIYPGYKHVEFEPVPPWELVVDEQAALNGETRQLIRVKYIPAERLMARFCHESLPQRWRADNERAIDKAVKDNAVMREGKKIITDLVKVAEAWHLPSGWGADDGYHAVCIEGRTLTPPKWRQWEIESFPFAMFRWQDPLIGWYPQGLVEEMEPIQGQENKLLGRIQDSMHLHSVTNTYYEEGSIKKEHMKNTSGNLIPVRKGSSLPKTGMPTSISSEVFRFVFDLDQRVYRDSGVSELSAQSIKPPGIDSGRGLMVLKDTESGRHAQTNIEWDDFHHSSAGLTICAGGEIHSRDGDYRTNFYIRNGTSKGIEQIKWSDVNMDKDMYEISIFPSSSLPHEPAGRIREVENLIEGGFIDHKQGLVLLRMPDLEQFASLETAAYEDIEMQIELMLVKGEEVRPEPFQDLTLGLAMMTSAMLRARTQGAPPENVKLLMDWIEEADSMLASAQAPEMPPPAAPMGPAGNAAGSMPPALPAGMEMS
jgi:hypothetical protein